MAVTNDFSASTLDLNGVVNLSQPTALVWGPDGRLYVTEVDGDVKVLTIAFGDPDPSDADATAQFYVTDQVTLSQVKTIPNFNDDGSAAPQNQRQVTGIDVTAQYDSNGDPVIIDGKPAVTMYVTSSDTRIGAGGSGNDANLDTNSGIITKLNQTGPDTWEAVDIVRGLARSEENHATNGLEVIQEIDDATGKLVSERLIVANGGNANTGAPSNNFAGQQEQPYSGAILEVDLDAINALTPFEDPVTGRMVAYDLPTLDNPNDPGADDNDPFGGDDGVNSAKLTADSPVQIYSAGYRNAYDVEVTDDGRVYTYDNGANNNWGGRTVGEPNFGDALYIALNLNNGDGNANDDINLEEFNPSNNDSLHEATRSDDLDGRELAAGKGGAQTYEWTYDNGETLTLVYGGHPNPTRAEGSRAGLLFSPEAGTDNAFLMVSNEDSFGNGGGSDYDEVIAWLTEVENNDTDYPTTGVYGADTGDLTKKVIAMTPGTSYDIYALADGSATIRVAGTLKLEEDSVEDTALPADATFIGTSGLPSDIADIVSAPNPIEGNYLEAGSEDGSLDFGKGSVNGLAEYTSTILDDGNTKMSGALLATSLNQGQIYVIGRDENGVVQTNDSGTFTTAADRTTIGAGGGPLGIATLGDNVGATGLTFAFTGSIWVATFNQNGPLIEIFQPEGVGLPLAGADVFDEEDNDLDGVTDIDDPFEFSAENGYALAAGQTIEIDFNPQNTNFPISISGTGLLGAALDGVTPNQDARTVEEGFGQDVLQDGLFDNAGNILPGGNAPILKIKTVVDGTIVGSENTARDVMQTGFRPAPEVDRIALTMSTANWIPARLDDPLTGQVSGMMFSDGTQSNFLRVVYGGVDGGIGFEVGFEIGDANYTKLATVLVPGLDDLNNDVVDIQMIIDQGNGFAVEVGYRFGTEGDFTSIPLNGGAGFSLPAGVLQDVLTGNHTIQSDGGPVLASGAAVGFLAEDVPGGDLIDVDFFNLKIESLANELDASNAAEVGQGGTESVDVVVYDGTDTELNPLANDVENFDGTGSSADFNVTGNQLDNEIIVGSGSNTVTTGAGEDKVIGTKASLSQDEITDFSFEDKVVITDATLGDAAGVAYSAGSAIVTLGSTQITFSGPDFENFDPVTGPATFQFNETDEGLEISRIAPETILYRINAGGNAGPAGATGTIAAIDGGPDWISDVALPTGVTLSGTTANTFSNAESNEESEIDGANVDLSEVPWQLFAAERSDNTPGDAPLGYNFAVEAGTAYKITLYYSEQWPGIFGFAGANGNTRQFDVSVNGTVPSEFSGLNPAQEAADLLNIPAVNGTTSEADQAAILGTAFQREVTVTAESDTLTLEFLHDVENPKVNAIQITQLGFVAPPVDETAPEIVDIFVENPLNDQDSPRDAIITLSDDIGFEAADFAGLDGSELVFTGIVPDAVGAPTVDISPDGQTATLTYELTPPSGAWPTGQGEINIANGAFSDAAGNTSAAASNDFFVEPNLDNLVAGNVALAINVGETINTVDETLAGDDKNTYGGAITNDTIIGIDLQADDPSYYSPSSKTASNIDGKFGATGSNPDLDGSALHTYRDSANGSFTATYPIANGVYVVELWFAELFHTTAGNRQGDYTINGQEFATDFDAFTAAGSADTAVKITKNVIVTNGEIVIDINDDTGEPGFNAIVVYDAIPSDLPPVISVADVQTAEGEDATITFSRIGDLSEDITVEFSLTDVDTDASDYGTATPATTVTILAGETSATVTLPIIDDEDDEEAEALTVSITSVSNTSNDASISPTSGSATVTIAASDTSTDLPEGGTILALDFETAGDPLVEGGFDTVLGGATALEAEKISVVDGKLVVTTSHGDLSNTPTDASKNDLVTATDLSDAGINDIIISTAFDNPFTEAYLSSIGATAETIPNYKQQGIIIATNDPATNQNPDQFMKVIYGGGNGTQTQMWSQASVDQPVKLTDVSAAAAAPFVNSDVARIELALVIDKDAGTIAQFVTFLDENGATLGGIRPVATPGFATAEAQPIPAALLAAINNGTSVIGVTSTDFGGPATDTDSFPATWDYLNVTSPQIEGQDGPDAVDNTIYADFSDDGLAPTDVGAFENGSNVVVAQQVGDDEGPLGRDRDYITFEIPEGQVLTAINLTGYENEEVSDTAGFIALQEGTQIDTDPVTGENFGNLLGGLIYSSGELNNDILALMAAGGDVQGFPFPGFELPLEAGNYTLWLNQGADLPTTVTLDFVLADRPADLTLTVADTGDVVEDGDFGTTLVDFEVTASDNTFNGDLEVTYDTLTDAGQVTVVTFINGVGTLSLSVDNDDIDNGAETVGITLVSAVDPNNILTVEVDTMATSADVTEDDAPAPLVRGDVVYAINAGGPALTQDGIDFAAATSPTDGAPFSGGAQFTDGNGGNGAQEDFNNTVYKTEINDNGNGVFSAAISFDGIDPNKSYFVDLYFGEIFASNPGDRIFDVSLEGETVLDDFDVLALNGGGINTPLVIEVPNAVTPGANGTIDIDFDALGDDAADRGKISAIVVREAVEDVVPTDVTISVADVEADEDGGAANVVFTRDGDTTSDVTVTFAVTDGTGVAGVDYETPVANTVTILAGETTATLPVTLIDNSADTELKEFTVSITDVATGGGESASLGQGTATVTIDDDEDFDPADIDGDGIINYIDPLAYDEDNGLGNVLTVGGAFRQDFNVDTTDPFSEEAGFTGIIVNTDGFVPAGTSGTDPYGDRTTEGNAIVEDGVLKVVAPESDSFGSGTGANNTLQDNYVRGADVSGVPEFSLEAKAANPWSTITSGQSGIQFASLGISMGAGGTDDWAKLVYSVRNGAIVVEFAGQGSFTTANTTTPVVYPAEATEAAADLVFRFDVTRSSDTEGLVGQPTMTGYVTLLDSDGNELQTVVTPEKVITGSMLAAMDGNNPLTGGTGGITYGISVTEWSNGAANGFTGEWDYIELRAPDNPPEVDAGIAAQAATEDTEFNFVLPLDVFKDDNGVVNLTLAATLGDDSPLPAWLSFDPETATFTGTPPDVGDLGDSDVLTIKVTADDGTNPPVSTTFELTIDGIDGPFEWYPDADGDGFGANVAPVIAYESPGAEGEFVNVSGDDDDNDNTIFPGAFEFNDGKDNDQDGETDEDQVAPTVVDETGTVFEDGVFVTSAADLLSNDSDDNLDPLTFDGVSNPVNGVVDYDDVSGEITFTPTQGFFGEASFDYSVSDGVGGVTTGTVTITVTEDLAPTVDQGIADQTVEETTAFDFTLPADVFADDGGVENLILSAVVVDSIDGEVFEDELPSWLTFDSATARFTGTPGDEDQGDLTVKVYAFDGKNPSTSTTFTLSVTDRAGPFFYYEDADNDGFGNENVFVEAYPEDAPEGYVLSDGRFDNDDDDNTVNPDAVEVNDGKDNNQDGKIDETNQAPTPGDDSAESLPNAIVTFTRAELLSNDTDPDGDTLTFDIVEGSGVGGTVDYNAGTGVITFTPDQDFTGTATFRYTVSDGIAAPFEGTAEAEVSINFNDDGSFLAEDIDLSAAAVGSYGSQDVVPSGLTLDDENDIALMEGNTWKQFGLGEGGLTITEGMKLKFTLKTDEIPEIIAIGLDNDNNFRNNPNAFFQLAGTQNLQVWNQTYRSDGTIVLGEETEFTIDLDALIGQTYANLVLINDNDANPSAGDSTFSNLQILRPLGANSEPVAAEDNFNMTNQSLLVLRESTLLENDTDADNDDLSIVNVSGAVNGTVSFVDGTITFDPDEGYTGPASFQYTIEDPFGAQSTTTVNVTVLAEGDGDVITDIDFTANPITSYLEHDSNPGAGFDVSEDGSSLTLSGNVWKKTALPGGDYTVTADTVLRLEITILNDTGEVVGIGLENDDNFRTDNDVLFQLFGSQNFSGPSNTDFFLDNVVVGQPVFVEIPIGNFAAGQSFATMVFLNDDDVNESSVVSFSNVQLVEVVDLGPGETEAPEIFGGAFDDQTLTQDAPFEIDLPFVDADTPYTDLVFTVENAPGFLNLVNGNVVPDGSLTGTPTNDDVGEYFVDITATDPEGNATTGTMRIVVENVNDAPEVVGTYENAVVIVNNQFVLNLPVGLFEDIDVGTQLIYGATGLPAGVTIDETTGAISGTPTEDGDFEVTITAYDGPIGGADTLSASTTFTLDVASGPPRETVLIEAEDFTSLTQGDAPVVEFYTGFAAPASGNQVIRTDVGAGFASISTDLASAGVSPGFYDISIIHMDESDGASTVTIKMVVGDAEPVEVGSFIMDRTDLPGQGPSVQAGNLTEAVFNTVNVPEGARLIIEGQTDAGELLRIDAVRFEPIDNTPPIISTPDTATVDEGTVLVADVDATDLEGSEVTYAISGGADAALFTIDPASGQVSFITAPDFETPLDENGDNVYEVTVEASDGDEDSEQALTITVANLDEVPEFSSATAFDAAENDTAAATVAAADPDGGAITYAIAGDGADNSLFTVNPATGVVTFLAAPDFETPTDANLDGIYEVSVTADDGTSSTTSELQITVTDENDAPVADPAPATQPVVIGAALSLPITGLFTDQDAGALLTYQLISGAPEGITGIDLDGNLVGTPTEGGSFDVVIEASDGIAPPVQVTLPLVVGAADDTFGPVAPFQDLDEDNIANSIDDDVDGDGILNVDDSFAYDANNGTLIADGESIELTFDVDGTPYQNGFTGLLQAGLVGSSDLKAFDEDTGNTSVAGGVLTTATTTGDTGGTDTPEDDFQLGVKNSDFTVEARVLNPFETTAAVSFDQIGIHVGVDSTDFVKFVFGNTVEFSSRIDNVEAKATGGNQALPAGLDTTGFSAVDITLAVNSTSATAATITAVATFIDTNGDPIAGAAGISFGSLTITGAMAEALADETVGVGTGFTHVHAGASASFNAQLDSFKVTATDGGSVDPTNALDVFAGEEDIFTGNSYGAEAVGSAVLEVMTGNNNIQSSNFGANSFELTNTGDKKIAAVFIDVTTAIYPDSVFDPDGSGGDSAVKAWGVNSGGAETGAQISGGDGGYFLPGEDPLPNTTGTGIASNGGFKGAIIKFTDFDEGEVVGFSGDMDPNSIAGLDKSGTNGIDTGATNGWDVGGISGHELIGSTFTILFDDGTTATGQLASDGSTAGSQGLATEDGLVDAPTLVVNGFAAGELGTYGVDQPSILVTGDPGATVRITMSKGFDPVTNTSNGIDALVEDRLDRYDFKNSNAFDAQTVDVVIGQDGTFDATGLFDYDDTLSNGGTFPGSDVADLAFVASVVDTANNDLPISPVTDPIYLTNEGGPVEGDPAGNGGSNAQEVFAGESDLITDAEYTGGEVGSAVLQIMAGVDNIEGSNFGANSFQVTNTGDKKISAVFIDVSEALYQDSVFDPDGAGGDNVAKAWAVNSEGGTGAFISGGTGGYFIPGEDPLANTTGTGIPSNGGYKGAIVKFTDFDNGETVGFSGDMDPNSIAGLFKGDVDGTAIDSWDVGGISGHELIGSRFTVLFDDGTTAEGQLASDGSASGSQALASQSQAPATTPTLEVNGVSAGGTGTYGVDQPTIIVTGDPGDTVRITLTKGFNPVVEPSNGIGQLVEDRLDRYDFKVNNNFDTQNVDVVIGENGTFDATGLFDYDDAVANNKADGTFAGDDVAQIAFVASVIDTSNGDLPISEVTAPIVLTNNGGPVVGDPIQPFNGYFEIVGSGSTARFKIQVEDPNGTGGTTPGADWTYATAADGDGNQSGFQGDGYYIWKDGATTGVNPPQGIIEYEIYVPEGEEGVYSFRARSSRDPGTPSDQANDIWLKIDDDAEALQVDETNSVSSGGFVKVFGVGTSNWGNSGLIDSASEEELNFKASFELSAGFHTIAIAGRSGGYAVDFIEFYKGTGGFPANNAPNSNFSTTPPGEVGEQIISTISASSDDWEQFGGAGSSDLEFGLNGATSQSVGMRFTGIDVPQDRVIADAYFQFEAFESQASAASFTIEIEDSEAAATYSTGSTPDARTYLTEDFEWNNVEAWTEGEVYRTPDISDLIEAAIGTDGVLDGELGFRITGEGSRVAHSFNSAGGNAPELVIVFEDDSIL